MATQALGEPKRSDEFEISWDFIIGTVSTERVITCVFLSQKPAI